MSDNPYAIQSSIIEYSDQHGKELRTLINDAKCKLEEFKQNPEKVDGKTVRAVVDELRKQLAIYKSYTEHLDKLLAEHQSVDGERS